MLGAKDAADAVRLEHELDGRSDGLGCGHAAMFAPEAPRRVGNTPQPTPELRMDSPMATNDPNLLERESELDALDRALAGAIGGRGSVVAIEGPPGIGKSSLVSSCLERARGGEM
jgi:hypothetical protein